MNYIKKLNLPSNPLCHGVIDRLKIKKTEFAKKSVELGKLDSYYHPTVITEVDQFLNSELLSACASIGLAPSYFVYFGLMDRLSYVTPIHIDVSPIAGNAKVSFAVNWELTATRSQWQWWDAGNAAEIALSAENTQMSEKQLLNGIRYGNDHKFQLIESYDLEPSTAYLVRADLPHCISYTNPTPERICISVRFDLATKITWSEAVALFEPLIIRQHQ